jgi:hypothetical protein
MDIDKLKEVPNDEPTVNQPPEDKPPEEPQLSDHDRRLKDYKDKQNRLMKYNR